MITSDLRNLVSELRKEIRESTNLFSENLVPTDKFHNHYYDIVYEHLFSQYRHREMNILEIGVLHGFSMLVWERYFTNSKIFGMDIEPKIPVLWSPTINSSMDVHQRLFKKQ